MVQVQQRGKQRLEPDRPRGRFNDGRRAWREDGEDNRGAPRGGRERSSYRSAPAVVRDPFFDKPYEAATADSLPPSWEVVPKAAPARGSISANIKPRRKLAALFKAPVPEAESTAK